MLQFSISFEIKFKCFILAHKVLHGQSSGCLFSIICLLPTCTLHFSQIGLHAVPWMGQDGSCHSACPVRKPSPSAHIVIGSVFEGPLCAHWSTLCLVLSPFSPLATLYPSLVVLEYAVSFNQL